MVGTLLRGLFGAVALILSVTSGADAAKLKLTAVTASGCTTTDFVAHGQQLSLSASGLSPGATVNFEFQVGVTTMSFPSATADGSGNMTTVVTIPSDTNGSPVYPWPAGIIASSNTVPTTFHVASFDLGPPGPVVDADGDGRPDFCDNCPNHANNTQDDLDSDGLGEACDSWPQDPTNDADGDGLSESDSEAPGGGGCPSTALNDGDNDDVCDDQDNCLGRNNPSQQDSDGNGVGDACQTDESCADGKDNDGDGLTDFPQDRGCLSASDKSEKEATLECDDGKDNDADGITDFNVAPGVGDPGCGRWWGAGLTESAVCDNGLDDDGDGKYDFDGRNGRFEADPACSAFGFDSSEVVPEPSVGMGSGMAVALLCWMGCRRRF